MAPLGCRVPGRGFYAVACEAIGTKRRVENRRARHRPRSAGDVTPGIGTAAGQAGVINPSARPRNAGRSVALFATGGHALMQR